MKVIVPRAVASGYRYQITSAYDSDTRSLPLAVLYLINVQKIFGEYVAPTEYAGWVERAFERGHLA